MNTAIKVLIFLIISATVFVYPYYLKPKLVRHHMVLIGKEVTSDAHGHPVYTMSYKLDNGKGYSEFVESVFYYEHHIGDSSLTITLEQ